MAKMKPVSVTPLADHVLLVVFNNDERRLFDVKPYIQGSWYGELENVDYFRTVSLLPGGSGIEWAHGQDIAPHELYEMSKAVE